jgi:hypothetical protein
MHVLFVGCETRLIAVPSRTAASGAHSVASQPSLIRPLAYDTSTDTMSIGGWRVRVVAEREVAERWERRGVVLADALETILAAHHLVAWG